MSAADPEGRGSPAEGRSTRHPGGAGGEAAPAASLEDAVEGALTLGLAASALALVAGLATGSEPALHTGILILLCTPIVRVVIVTVGLARERDWLFAGLSLGVLLVLASSVAVAVVGHGQP